MSRSSIDPEIREFTDRISLAYKHYPDIATLSFPQARRVVEEVRAPWTRGGPDMVDTREIFVPTRHGRLRVRIYDPGVPHPAATLVYMHGGGFTLFSIDTHDRVTREYAARGGLIVISVDYALSPEAKYPVALDEIVDLLKWLAEDGAEFGVDPARIAVGGDSAGANLAIASALRLRALGKTGLIGAMLLNYGGFKPDCSDEAEAMHGGEGAILNRAEIDYFWGNYLDGPHNRADPLACPILAELESLPPAFLVIAECDVLAEQNLEMAARLEAAGVMVQTKIYRGATHSFLEAVAVSRISGEALEDGARWIRKTLG
jgi:acetyl esterase